jgi:hypothetical protein
MRSLAGSASMIAWASWRGLRRAGFASCNATFVAKSPCAASRVRSTSTAGRRMSAGKMSAGNVANAAWTSFSIWYFKVNRTMSAGTRDLRV